MHGDSDKTDSFQEALNQLASLRRFTGSPAIFWQSYLDAMVTICGARCGLIVRQRKNEGTGWRKVVASPANLGGEGLDAFFSWIEKLGDAALEDGEAVREISPQESDGMADYGIAVRLETGRSTEQWVAVFLLNGVSLEWVDEMMKRLLLANCLPADVQHYQSSNRAPGADVPIPTLP